MSIVNNVNQDGLVSSSSTANDSITLQFVIKQYLSKVRTSAVVQVKAVRNNGGLSEVGFVDIQPMVTQVDNLGNVVAHTIIRNVPYIRIQGGKNAIIIDPEVGDIGLATFTDRDISAVKSSKKVSPPGSQRRFHFADAVYVGGLLNGIPEQYFIFNSDGITIKSPTKITIDAPNITINGSLTVTEDATIKNIKYSEHVHGGVQGGSDNTSPPS